MVECPTCERTDFQSKRGMLKHHTITHGESLLRTECDYCGREYTLSQRKEGNTFCSRDCYSKYRSEVYTGKNNPNWTGGNSDPNIPARLRGEDPEDLEKCRECGSTVKSLPSHWSHTDCPYPEITEKQHEILTGLLMGDGWATKQSKISKNSSICTEMITLEFLKWLDSELNNISRGISKARTAEEGAKIHRKSGFNPNANADTYSDIYKFSTISHPELNKYRSWYGSRGKKFPDDLELTPLITKVWYCCDGSFHTSTERGQALFACFNESDRINFILELFKEKGFNPTTQRNESIIAFSSDETEDLFEWMGDFCPGFSYKWDYHSKTD